MQSKLTKSFMIKTKDTLHRENQISVNSGTNFDKGTQNVQLKLRIELKQLKQKYFLHH